MNEYNLEIGSDGCPNDCGYCREMSFPCIYESNDSPLAIKPYECCICGKKLTSRDTYNHRDKDYCEPCFGSKVC